MRPRKLLCLSVCVCICPLYVIRVNVRIPKEGYPGCPIENWGWGSVERMNYIEDRGGGMEKGKIHPIAKVGEFRRCCLVGDWTGMCRQTKQSLKFKG